MPNLLLTLRPIDFLIFIDANLYGWILIDLLANLLLKRERTGTKFRIIGARWLKREVAVKVASAQFILAFTVSFFIVDWLYTLISITSLYLVPVTITAMGLLYLYILLSLPYEVTLRRSMFSIVSLLLAAALTLLIYYRTQIMSWVR